MVRVLERKTVLRDIFIKYYCFHQVPMYQHFNQSLAHTYNKKYGFLTTFIYMKKFPSFRD